jgi:hypothetical protein
MMLQAVIAKAESYVPRGLLMVPVCVFGFNIWRGQPYPLAHAVNAAGVMAIILALAAVRLASRETISTALLLLLGVVAVTLATPAGEASNVARVLIGGLFLTAALSVTVRAEGWFDWALAAGLWAEVAAWTLGNAARGTFGSDVAVSAIGQAYGAWAQPAQWAAIIAAYVLAWYNLKAKKV